MFTSLHCDTLRTWRPTGSRPRSVYIHVPFCRHRCGYCNFTLVAGRDHLIQRYLDALETEIGWLDQTYELDTLFLGGGTPSHLNSDQLRRLRQIVDSRFTLTGEVEATAECNPNDQTPEKADALQEFGINRISLGVQSLNPETLSKLERDHTAADVERAVELGRRFANSISFDLIFAAPGQSMAEWQHDLEQALSYKPDHLSTYELTYEKGTQFWNRLARGELAEADEDLRADMYTWTTQRLENAGLPAYEISSFARVGHRCGHNQIYWSGEPYFAFGPGASRYVDGIRQTNHQSTLRYFQRIESGECPVAEEEQLSPLDSARELLAIGLRQTDGVDEIVFSQRTGFSIDQLLGAKRSRWIENKLMVHDSGRWRLTFAGRMLCDRLAGEIVGSGEAGERG